MKSYPIRDFAPWLLLPSAVLTLGSVTLLAPHQAALAAPPATPQPAQAAPASDDGDGDELLEHWGDPAYSREEKIQLGGIAAGFLVLAGASACRRARRRNACRNACGIVSLPSERDFLKQDSSADVSFRKAA